jgi:hypothetical protein
MKRLFAATVSIALVASAAQAMGDAQLFGPGVWVSQNNTVLTISSLVPATGQLSGTLVTQTSKPTCTANGIPQPIAGWYNAANHLLTFSVNWDEKGCNAVVSWSGHFDPETGVIALNWTRVSGLNGTTTDIGTGEFRPQSPP